MTQLLHLDHSRIGILLFNNDENVERHRDRIVAEPIKPLTGIELFMKYGDQAYEYALSQEKIDPQVEAEQKSQEQKMERAIKAHELSVKIKNQIDELYMLSMNFGGMAYLHTPLDKDGKPKLNKTKVITQDSVDGLALLKRTIPADPVKPHVLIQRVYNLKKQTLDNVIESMKKREAELRLSVEKSQAKIKELLPYSKTSNLAMYQANLEAPSLQLCIYHPSYHIRRVNKDEYMIPIKDFDEEIKERAKGKKLYFEVIVNMNANKRVVVNTADLLASTTPMTKVHTSPIQPTLTLAPTLSNMSLTQGVTSVPANHLPVSAMASLLGTDNDIAMKLINLGELKIFQKLKTIFGTEKNPNTISLLNIPNLINFRLIEGEPVNSNIHKGDAFFCLIVSS